MPKRKKTKHPQVTLTLRNNSEIQVDHDIHELIEIMNSRGLTTLNSCQDDRGTAYIQFRGIQSKPFMQSLLTKWLVEKRHKPQGAISFANPANSKHPNSFQIRWNPSDYGVLLHLARKALQD